MNFIFKATIGFLIFCFGFIANAQSDGKITGTITSSEKSLESIIVTLLNATDNSLVKTEITQSDGSFSFEKLKTGSYTIAIENPGFNSFQSQPILLNAEQSTFHLSINLQPIGANNLDEVVIVKKKPFVEYKIDRTVVNVDAMIANAGADAMEVLEKSPGIIVDQNGTITLKGKSGIMVYIDDKPTNLSGSDLEVYLKSLPASTLNQIEIITNPPARYEAAGSSGIINIITKKSKTKGFNGNITSRVSKGKRNHVRNGLNLTYNNDKIRLTGNLSHAAQKFVNDLYIFRRYKNEDLSTKTLFDQNTNINTKNNTLTARLGLDYYVSDRTTFGINFTGLIKTGDEVKDGKSVLRNSQMVLDSTIVADNREKDKFKNGGVNLNFRHQIDTLGRKITADFDYLNYSTENDQNFKNFIYQPDNSLSSADELTGNLPAKINIFSFKTDYVHPLKNQAQFDTGYKISYSQTDNVANYADVVEGIPTPNYDSSNHFKYDEIINAAYINYNRSFKRLGVQAGLRLENTISKGNQLGNILKPASTFKRDYTNLFPTVYLSYKLDSIANNQLVLSYGKRIDRPYFQDLNPFLSPLDKFTYYSGNPYLDPSFSHNVQFTYSYKSLFSSTVSYSKTKDNINETIEINDGIYYSRPGNIGKSQIFSINVNGDFPITKWYSVNIYSELTNMGFKSKLYTEDLNSNGTFVHFSAQNRFVLGKDWSGEISGNYTSDIESAQFTVLERGSVNFAVQKKILKGNGTLKLLVNDIFYTNMNNGIINNLKLTDAHWKNRGDTRFAALVFTYAFGKVFQAKDNHEATGAESEQSRVKG